MINRPSCVQQSMLSEHCGGRISLQKTLPRRPTYSSLSRYGKSTVRRGGVEPNSASLSASDETQRLTHSVRPEVLQKRVIITCAISHEVPNDSTRICMPRTNNECVTNCTHVNGNRSAMLSPESNGQDLNSITVLGLNQITSNNNTFENRLTKTNQPPLKTITLGKCFTFYFLYPTLIFFYSVDICCLIDVLSSYSEDISIPAASFEMEINYVSIRISPIHSDQLWMNAKSVSNARTHS